VGSGRRASALGRVKLRRPPFPRRDSPAARPLTTVILLVCLLLTAYAVLARRRHLRLKAACDAAFGRCYAGAVPRPRFEMSYSYGEPAFLVQFASKADAAAAADANTAFLREIDELCKARGRKRQFQAARSVFFRHPADPDEARVTHCCEAMRAQVGHAIAYAENTKAYGLRTSKVGTPALPIAHCPWCGSTLPPAPPNP
jgi:hypothetical protein